MLLPLPAYAQARIAQPGDTILVDLGSRFDDGLQRRVFAEIEGVLDSVVRDTAFLHARGSSMARSTVPVSAVQSVQVDGRRYRPVIKYALVGFALGAVIGALAYRPCSHQDGYGVGCPDSRHVLAIGVGVPGLLLGAAIGATEHVHWIAATFQPRASQ